MSKHVLWRIMVAFLLAASLPHWAQAADITVDETTCTLADAITSANSDADTGNCVASGAYGDDTIALQTDITLGAALPEISSTITIEGNGYTIDGNGGNFSVLAISKDGDLTLNETTVTGSTGSGISCSPSVELSLTNAFSSVTVNSSTISGNGGSGIYSSATSGGFNTLLRASYSVTVNSSTISGNGGSGISSIPNSYPSSVTVNSSTISGNGGSGISSSAFRASSSVTVNSSTISGNGESGISCSSSSSYSSSSYSITVKNSTISGNDGSGIFCSSPADYSNPRFSASSFSITVNSSTISGNGGSGIFSSSGVTTLTNLSSSFTVKSSTISGNGKTDSGTANEIYIRWLGSTNKADASNVFGHSGETNAEAFSSFFKPGASDLTATSDGALPTALTAILGPLVNNGGPTLTHALVAGSPAIDRDATCSIGLTEDQRGYPRPIGDGCDAGAVEYDPSNTDSDSDGHFDAADNCPLVANADQVDRDGNGIGDACDASNDKKINLISVYMLLLNSM